MIDSTALSGGSPLAVAAGVMEQTAHSPETGAGLIGNLSVGQSLTAETYYCLATLLCPLFIFAAGLCDRADDSRAGHPELFSEFPSRLGTTLWHPRCHERADRIKASRRC